jgi:hypothetical protein
MIYTEQFSMQPSEAIFPTRTPRKKPEKKYKIYNALLDIGQTGGDAG